VTNLGNSEDDPISSPDGSAIGFSSDIDCDHGAFVMNTDGSAVTQLTSNTARDSSPCWSPDGGKVVFVGDPDGNTEVCIRGPDGTRETRAMSNPH
jgi:TolB protein